jgi:hypothetical protein
MEEKKGSLLRNHFKRYGSRLEREGSIEEKDLRREDLSSYISA